MGKDKTYRTVDILPVDKSGDHVVIPEAVKGGSTKKDDLMRERLGGLNIN